MTRTEKANVMNDIVEKIAVAIEQKKQECDKKISECKEEDRVEKKNLILQEITYLECIITARNVFRQELTAMYDELVEKIDKMVEKAIT